MGMSIAASRPSIVALSQPISTPPKAPAIQAASDDGIQSLEALLSKQQPLNTQGDLGRILNTLA